MILVFLLGGIGIQAIVSHDRSLTNALLAITTVALMHVLVAWLKMYSEKFRRFVDGTPIVLVEEGRWHEERIRRLRLHTQDIMAAARQGGIERMDQIRFGVVERNGSASIVRKAS